MSFLKRTTALFLIVLMFVALFSFTANAVSYPCEAFVTGSSVNIRSDAGTGYSIKGTAGYRQVVTLNSEKTGSDGYKWYAVSLSSGVNGYIRSDFIKLKDARQELKANGETNKKTTMYSLPGDWNEAVVAVPINTKAVIYAKDYDYDGDMWYYASIIVDGKEYKGYLFNTRVDIKADYVENKDFEAHLTAQGFPESYKEKLREVYALHPSWIFIADHIDLTWEEAMDLQTPVGKSLVNYALPESWRSMKPGAYDWNKQSYVSLDTGPWYAAHEDVIAYYLDPRNFLSSSKIFQFVGMSFNENVHTKEALQKMLEGTFMEGDFPESSYDTWADVLFAACEEYSMSPYALASMILTEQGRNGSGKLISGKEAGYEGYYNFLSVQAYEHSGNSAVKNGLEYAKQEGKFSRPWDNRVDAIFGGAEFYTYEYVQRGQDTLYYKKFNVAAAPFGMHQYMTNIIAAYQEGIETSKSYEYTADNELVFNIPVYKDMPETAVAYPTETGNNNFYLSSLSVDGYDISPSFNIYNNTYELVVDGSVSKVSVSADLWDSDAKISGLGEYWLEEGKNTIDVTVTSTSSRTNTYRIIIYRNGSGGADISFNKDAYYFSGTYMSGVLAGTSATAVKTNLEVKNATAIILNASLEENTGTVCTGDIVHIIKTDGSIYESYSVAVKGDINGDGKISLIDLARIQRHLLAIEQLEGVYSVAADISGDGKISLIDLAKVQRHLLSIESIN